jgi:hypothetical protein
MTATVTGTVWGMGQWAKKPEPERAPTLEPASALTPTASEERGSSYSEIPYASPLQSRAPVS